MSPALATVSLNNLDGIGKDGVTWGFAFDNDPTGGTTVADIGSWLDDFFTHDYGSGQVIHFGSTCLDWANVLVRVYDLAGHLDGSPHGSPVGTSIHDWSLFQPNQRASGNQLSAVISYHVTAYAALPTEGPTATLPTPESAQDYGAPATFEGTTKPKARGSGRIYFGPIGGDSYAGDTNNNPVLTAAAITSFAAAPAAGMAGGTNAHGLTWAVWSRRLASLTGITGGWVDHCVKTRRLREFVNNQRTVY